MPTNTIHRRPQIFPQPRDPDQMTTVCDACQGSVTYWEPASPGVLAAVAEWVAEHDGCGGPEPEGWAR